MIGLQQTLELSIKSQKTFNNFLGASNADKKDMLMFFLRNPTENLLLLVGDNGVGKSHLLHAACHLYQEQGMSASFISFNYPTDIEALLNQKLSGKLICIDDIDLSSGHSDLENMLFRLYNHAELEGCKMIWGMKKSAIYTRKDLQSRVSSMLSIELMPYSPDETLEILMGHLTLIQSHIPIDVCKLLIQKHSRHISRLISKVREIEQHSCLVQKRVTLKMVKELIDEDLHQLD